MKTNIAALLFVACCVAGCGGSYVPADNKTPIVPIRAEFELYPHSGKCFVRVPLGNYGYVMFYESDGNHCRMMAKDAERLAR